MNCVHIASGLLRAQIRPSFRFQYICRQCLTTTSPPARTRFAPSPTGRLHLGSLRTALYNYLWAKRTGGQFLLRIEDTDQNRLSAGAETSLFDNLAWAGLSIDEGPETGGKYGPYRQSERLPLYHKHIKILLEKGNAYRCFCGTERLEKLREQARKAGLSGTYDRHCYTLPAEESERRAQAGEAHVVRLRAPDAAPQVTDIVHGTIDFTNRKKEITFVDDSILMKSDGFPTYHFANVVDDHLMQITHVIRGEEWLPSTPKHLAIYQAFGWTAPQFAHVPLLASVGGAKLSKRHGDTTVEAFRERGYLPEAMLNYLALMGWNAPVPQGGSEVMSLREMVDRFELTHITKGATVVTMDKLQFLQKQHYHRCADDEPEGLSRLVRQLQPVIERGYPETTFSDDYVGQVIVALKERTVDPLGVPDLGSYFFAPPEYNSAEATKFASKFAKKSEITLPDLLARIHRELQTIEEGDWTGTEFNLKIEKFFKETEFQVSHGLVMGAIRYALAGGQSGAGVKQIMAVVGRPATLERLEAAEEHARRYLATPT